MNRNADTRGQVVQSAAEIYDSFFVGALFGQFAGPCCDAARVETGSRVLDAACGTGVVAREALRRAAETGQITGLDINRGMLDVARRTEGVEWVEGDVTALPFADGSFDAVICQFGLMFFPDRIAVLRELYRVLAPGSRLVVAVWDKAENSPGYADLIRLLARIFDEDAADSLRPVFALGEARDLQGCFRTAGIATESLATVPGTASFASIEDWMHTEIRGWTLADRIDDDGFARLLEAAEDEFRPYVGPDGRVEFAAPAHLAVAKKPS